MKLNNYCTFYFEDSSTNRKKLFEEAISHAQNGKVLYILSEELNELPELSQDLESLNKHYMKMINFLYVKNLDSLIEIVSMLHSWHCIPLTIILDDLNAYCKNNLQNACGLLALLLDSTRSCSKILNLQCQLYISIPRMIVGDEYCNLLCDLYGQDTK